MDRRTQQVSTEGLMVRTTTSTRRTLPLSSDTHKRPTIFKGDTAATNAHCNSSATYYLSLRNKAVPNQNRMKNCMNNFITCLLAQDHPSCVQQKTEGVRRPRASTILLRQFHKDSEPQIWSKNKDNLRTNRGSFLAKKSFLNMGKRRIY